MPMRSALGAVAILLVTTAVAACGGEDTSTTGALTRTTKVEPCTSLSEEDVVRVSGLTDLRRFDFAFPEGENILCSTGWSSGAVTAVVTLTEREGGAAELRRLRSLQVSEVGKNAVVPYPSLGSGAFVAGKRYLAFLHDDRVITLETFLEDGARYVLTPGELAELARSLQ